MAQWYQEESGKTNWMLHPGMMISIGVAGKFHHQKIHRWTDEPCHLACHHVVIMFLNPAVVFVSWQFAVLSKYWRPTCSRNSSEGFALVLWFLSMSNVVFHCMSSDYVKLNRKTAVNLAKTLWPREPAILAVLLESSLACSYLDYKSMDIYVVISCEKNLTHYCGKANKHE